MNGFWREATSITWYFFAGILLIALGVGLVLSISIAVVLWVGQ